MSLRAAGASIGTRFRWLTRIGIADFTGDGLPEIAYLEMPHLARRLVLVGLRGDRFVPLARRDGLRDHRIGEAFVTGGLRDCGAGPELVLSTGDWRRTARVRFTDGKLVAVDDGAFAGRPSLEATLSC